VFCLQIKEAIIDITSVQFVMLDTYEKISLKITYEFSTFAADQLVELVNYEETLTTVGSFSIIAHPQLTVFESTSMYYIVHFAQIAIICIVHNIYNVMLNVTTFCVS